MRSGLIFGIVALGLGIGLPVLASSQTGPLVVSVTTSPNPYAIEGRTSVPNSSGILAYATATKDVALQGYATQPGATGLEGFAQATSGAASNGVFGYSGNGTGVYGVSAVLGAPGVFGTSQAAGGIGIYGKTSGTGMLGVTTGTGSGEFAGVEGIDDSQDPSSQFGVLGVSAAGTGVVGIVGPFITPPQETELSYSDEGVAGVDNTTSSGHVGLFGSSQMGYGVFAQTEAGNSAIIAVAENNPSGDGAGLQAESVGGTGMQAFIKGTGDAFEAFEGDTFGDGYSEIAHLDSLGNLAVKGTVSAQGSIISASPDRTGVERATYEQRATQSTVEDFGHGRLSVGRAAVALDPNFASILADASDYYVFVTPIGPGELYVSDKTPNGFEVRSLSGASALAFDYRVVGRPRTTHDEPRLAAVDMNLRSKGADARAGHRRRAPYALGRAVRTPLGEHIPQDPPMPFVPRPH